MKAPVGWLKQYVRTDAPPERIAEWLTHAGLSVEGVEGEGDAAVLEVEVTYNRGDCNGIVGLAREVAAASGCALSLPELPEANRAESGEDPAALASIDVEDPERCPRYIGRLIRGVKVGPSPGWLQDRLKSMGLQPINNIVDTTNFVLFELNQPLHAFDHDRLAGGRIVVRRAEDGEPFTPLYGESPRLTGEDLMIADAQRPVALAGIVGGAGSEVSAETTNILLEAAVFNPVSTRRSARRHGIATDSSFRFERGVDPVGVDFASRRAAALIAELSGGAVLPGSIDTNPDAYAPAEAHLRTARVEKLLGCEVPREEVRRILTALGFEIVSEKSDGDTWRVPPWRAHDVSREVDLIEEVARIHGYGRIPECVGMTVRIPARNPHEDIKDAARDALADGGYHEVITDSLVDRGAEALLNPWQAAGALDLGDTAMRSDHAALRVSLLPGMLEVKLRNQNEAGRRTIRIFQAAPVYLPRGEKDLPEEKLCLAILDDGTYDHLGNQIEEKFLRLKGAVERVLGALHVGPCTWRPGRGERFVGFDSESAQEIAVGDTVIGIAGEPAAEQLVGDLQIVPAVAEIDLDALLQLERRAETFTPLPRFPAVRRDVALIVDESVPWDAVRRAVDAARPEHLVSVELLDLFRGTQVGEGKKSLAFRLEYRSPERTLTDEEVNAANGALVEHLCKTLDATQRGA